MNLSDIGRTFDAFHAGACVACLPLGSSTMARINPAAAWTVTDFKLHSILCCLTGKQLPFPWDKDETYETATGDETRYELRGFATVEEYLAWESQEWEDIDGKQFSL